MLAAVRTLLLAAGMQIWIWQRGGRKGKGIGGWGGRQRSQRESGRDERVLQGSVRVRSEVRVVVCVSLRSGTTRHQKRARPKMGNLAGFPKSLAPWRRSSARALSTLHLHLVFLFSVLLLCSLDQETPLRLPDGTPEVRFRVYLPRSTMKKRGCLRFYPALHPRARSPTALHCQTAPLVWPVTASF
jgi:hypothetical protein